MPLRKAVIEAVPTGRQCKGVRWDQASGHHWPCRRPAVQLRDSQPYCGGCAKKTQAVYGDWAILDRD